MYILKGPSGQLIRIKDIQGNMVRLCLDTDNPIACFSTRASAVAAMGGDDDDEYCYRHTLAVAGLPAITIHRVEEMS